MILMLIFWSASLIFLVRAFFSTKSVQRCSSSSSIIRDVPGTAICHATVACLLPARACRRFSLRWWVGWLVGGDLFCACRAFSLRCLVGWLGFVCSASRVYVVTRASSTSTNCSPGLPWCGYRAGAIQHHALFFYTIPPFPIGWGCFLTGVFLIGFTDVHAYVLRTLRERTRDYGLETGERVWLATYVRTCSACVRDEEDAPGDAPR